MSRFVFMVLDGVGVGALPDAAAYGDAGSDTLGNLSRVVDLRLPYLERLGLGNLVPLRGVPPAADPGALVGRLATRSAGKDTTIGHWEHMGLVTPRPFPTYPHGFPEEVIAPFVRCIGRGILGNKPASGTAIIAELGKEHLATGKPIVYTSADSVFQIATHVDVVPLEVLYRWCEAARKILQGPHAVARVIARPFNGLPGAFARTRDRRDFSLPPLGPTYLDLLGEAGIPVLAVGKIAEVFGGRGITHKLEAASNDENLALVQALLEGRSERGGFNEGLLFTNLVDFDTLWGHRNDVEGFASGLAAFDAALPRIVTALRPGDSLLLTADHGVDPTTVSTDHSREYVPLLLYPRPLGCPAAVYEGTLADTGATCFAALTRVDPPLVGEDLVRLRPSRGWRRHTPLEPCPSSGDARREDPFGGAEEAGGGVPARVGRSEVEAAVRYVRGRLGAAPAACVVLGSGLAAALKGTRLAWLRYTEVPFWQAGGVSGHPYRLSLLARSRGSVALLEGRLHGYEGFDLSELQLTVRTMARWGVKKVLLTSSCGAVAAGRHVGDVVIDLEMLDLQVPLLCGRTDARPTRIPATSTVLARCITTTLGSPSWLVGGVHVAVPGPQYETDAELALLRGLGGTTVSMSGTPELLAARDEGLEAAGLSLVVNAGHTTHAGVLAGADEGAAAFNLAVDAVLACWGC